MVSREAVGRHLRDARNRRKLTQENVAEQAGISASYYGRVERGQASPSTDLLAELCDVLRIPLPEVFIGAYSPKQPSDPSIIPGDEFIQYFTYLDETVPLKKKAGILDIVRKIMNNMDE